jgi:hypothetical protein
MVKHKNHNLPVGLLLVHEKNERISAFAMGYGIKFLSSKVGQAKKFPF